MSTKVVDPLCKIFRRCASAIPADRFRTTQYGPFQGQYQGRHDHFPDRGKGYRLNQGPRHGKVPVMNIDHEPVACTPYDYYAGDWVGQSRRIEDQHQRTYGHRQGRGLRAGRKPTS